MEEYLREISTGSREPSISYLIGSSGIGKKTFLSKCFKKLQFNPIHISPLFNKQSIVCAKKNMIQEIESLVLNQNITQFFSTSKDIIVLENLHVIPDKNFFDALIDLKNKSLRSHIVCVLNTDFISERFLDYVIKSCDVFTFKSKSPRALRNIFRHMSIDLGIEYPNELDEIIKTTGNMYELKSHLLQFATTRSFKKNTESCFKIDKHLIENTFKFLCDPNETLIEKLELIKPQHSLCRLLIVKHVVSGLDIDDKPFDEKIEIAIKCLEHICEADRIPNHNKHAYIQQIIVPCSIVQKSSIRGLCLANQFNELSVSKTFSPNFQSNFLYILLCLKHCILNDIDFDVRNLLPNLTNENYVDIQKCFKIFDEPISKKKFNEFRNRNILNL